jgi:hypothetical protein
MIILLLLLLLVHRHLSGFQRVRVTDQAFPISTERISFPFSQQLATRFYPEADTHFTTPRLSLRCIVVTSLTLDLYHRPSIFSFLSCVLHIQQSHFRWYKHLLSKTVYSETSNCAWSCDILSRTKITTHWQVYLLLQHMKTEDSSPDQTNTVTHQTYVSQNNLTYFKMIQQAT